MLKKLLSVFAVLACNCIFGIPVFSDITDWVTVHCQEAAKSASQYYVFAGPFLFPYHYSDALAPYVHYDKNGEPFALFHYSFTVDSMDSSEHMSASPKGNGFNAKRYFLDYFYLDIQSEEGTVRHYILINEVQKNNVSCGHNGE